MNGAATNPDFDVVARAAVQIKNAIDATIELGGTNYVFWGGREGYMSLLNTDQKREKEHLATMLRLARDYAAQKASPVHSSSNPSRWNPASTSMTLTAKLLSASSSSTVLTRTSRSTSKLTTQLSPVTFRTRTRSGSGQRYARLYRRKPRRLSERLGYRPVPHRQLRTHQAMMLIIRSGGLGNGGTNFDAKDPSQLDRSRRHLHRPHRRHGCYGPRAESAQPLFSKNHPTSDMLHERYASFDAGYGQGLQRRQLTPRRRIC